MMSSTCRMSIAVSLVAGLMAACGSDDDGGNGGNGSSGTVTGLPSSKQLKDLTPEDAKKACEESGKYFNQQVSTATQDRAGCVIAAAATLGMSMPTKEECDMFVADCVANSMPEPTDCSMAGTGDLTDCTVTVGEAEDCVKAQVSQLKPVFDKLTCDLLISNPQEILDALGALEQSPAACSALEEKCPGFLGSESGG